MNGQFEFKPAPSGNADKIGWFHRNGCPNDAKDRNLEYRVQRAEVDNSHRHAGGADCLCARAIPFCSRVRGYPSGEVPVLACWALARA